MDRRGRAEPRPLGDGRAPLRRPVPLAVLHARAHARDLRDLLRHPLPEPRALGGAAAAGLGREPLARRARRRVRREVGLGAGQLVRVERRSRGADESLRPRGWAGQHWSPAIGAEHRATREAVAIFDESSFAKLEIEGPGAAELLERLCDNRVAREVGKITYTQMLNARGGIECDFTVARLGEELFQIVTGTAFGNHDREWIRKHLPDDGIGVSVRDVTSAWSCFGIWGPRARDVLAPLTPGGPRQRRLPLHDRPRDHGRRRSGAGAAGHLRRRARLGDLLPDRVRARALADALGGRRAARDRRRRLPRDRLDAAREGLPRLGRRHHARRDALRGRGRLLRQARQGGRLHRPRGAARGEGGRPADAASAA